MYAKLDLEKDAVLAVFASGEAIVHIEGSLNSITAVVMHSDFVAADENQVDIYFTGTFEECMAWATRETLMIPEQMLDLGPNASPTYREAAKAKFFVGQLPYENRQKATI
jgi:hypothetical protein